MSNVYLVGTRFFLVSDSQYEQGDEGHTIEQPYGCVEAVYEAANVSNCTHYYRQHSLALSQHVGGAPTCRRGIRIEVWPHHVGGASVKRHVYVA